LVTGYGLVAMVVLFGIIAARRRLAAGTASAAAGEVDGQPYAIAYLSGGPERTLMAVVASMWVAGTVVAHGAEVRAEGRLDGTASELERAIHLSAATPLRWDYLEADPTVFRGLEQLRRGLEDAGLLLSAEQQRRIKRTGWWMVALAVLGLPVATTAGVDKVTAGCWLILALFVAGVLIVHAPRHSRRGTAMMQALCARYAALAPHMEPDWTAYGPAWAGVAVGIFGASTLSAMSPDFANLVAERYWLYWLGWHRCVGG
jgi:uncharacterized protein (TIGR04222 family)